MSKIQAAKAPLHTRGVETNKTGVDSKQQFFVLALNMSWQLAIVVLVPIIGGAELDKAQSSSHTFLFIGLGLALIGSGAVMRRAMQAANRLPVPKLTAEEKRKIQKQYEEDDD